jgi:anaerobic C4-dicarboxylate transporter
MVDIKVLYSVKSIDQTMRDVPQTYPWSLLVTFNNKSCLVFSQPAQIICLECRDLLLSGLGAVGRLLLGIMYFAN